LIVNIAIKDYSSISALGSNVSEIWENYLANKTCLSLSVILPGKEHFVGKLSCIEQDKLNNFVGDQKGLHKADRSVQLACFTAKEITKGNDILSNCGVNAGSSRGATGKLEEAYAKFQKTGLTPVQTSPLTTAGNVASAVAQTLGVNGVSISHSITCSTTMHGLLNGIAWLNAGFTEQFVVTGTEAPLTPFTIKQMEMLGIYSQKHKDEVYPSQPLNFEKEENTMVLGEGAISFLLSKECKNPKGKIVSIGYSREMISSGASISSGGKCIEEAMEMALDGLDKTDVACIVSHSPGTYHGDLAEQVAIKKVFQNDLPPCTNNKWKIGHTFGASGGFSIEMAFLMLKNKTIIFPPYLKKESISSEKKLVVVNSVGFGGNAVSIIISE
jgi:3-oxoacyl-[acyl-carrier-protein] synthase II